MTNEGDKPERKYDLEERTARFGEAIIVIAKRVPVNPVNAPLITQLVKAGTSIGAIIARRMTPNQKRISCTRLAFAEKNLGKPSIGCA